MNTLKTCSKCQKELSITEFFRDKQNKDGFSMRCKQCKNKGVKKPAKGITPPFTHTRVSVDPKPKESMFIADRHLSESIHKDLDALYAKTPATDDFSDVDQMLVNRSKKVKIEGENLFQRLSKRFGSTYTVTIRKDGKATCQVHSSPALHFKAQTPESLLEKIMC